MGNLSRRRLAGLIVAGVILLVIMVSGFSRVVLTDAAWSDTRTLSATFEAEPPEVEAEAPEVIIPDTVEITGLRCDGVQNGKPKEIYLSWDKPSEWKDFAVVYDVSWQDNRLTSYTGHTTIDEPPFTFAAPAYPGNGNKQHTDLTFTIQAKLADGGGQSKPVTIDAEGPTQGGVLRCGTSPHR